MSAAAIVEIEPKCHGCMGEKMHVKVSLCMGCRLVSYGDKACQTAKWKVHKLACKKIQDIMLTPCPSDQRSKAIALGKRLLAPEDSIYDPVAGILLYNAHICKTPANPVDPFDIQQRSEIAVIVLLLSKLKRQVSCIKKAKVKILEAIAELKSCYSATDESAKRHLSIYVTLRDMDPTWKKAYDQLFPAED